MTRATGLLEPSPLAIKRRSIELLRSMRDLAFRSHELEKQIAEVHRERRIHGPESTRDAGRVRERQNEMSFLRAELEMSQEMHARLEGVFRRLVRTLDREESEALLGMYQVSGKLKPCVR